MKRRRTLFFIASFAAVSGIVIAAMSEQDARKEGEPQTHRNSLMVQPESLTEKLTITDAAILGVVEGITEYLPVSSTGHLILAGHFMKLIHYSDQTGAFGKLIDKDKMEAVNSFNIVIQFGAILAVVGLYRKRVGQMCAGLVGKNPKGLRLFGLLVVAFLPAVIIGLPLDETIEAYLFGPVPVAWALAIGGIVMIVVEYFYRKGKLTIRVCDLDMVTFRQALTIGIAQILAMWPGTSRSMITILAALLVGLDMLAAAEFSFLLALPTLMGATTVSAVKHWDILTQVAGIDGIVVGLVVSGIIAALASRVLLNGLHITG